MVPQQLADLSPQGIALAGWYPQPVVPLAQELEQLVVAGGLPPVWSTFCSMAWWIACSAMAAMPRSASDPTRSS